MNYSVHVGLRLRRNRRTTVSCCESRPATRPLDRAGDQCRLFVGEFGAGWWAGSTALQADSLDSLGDAGVYALSLFVVGRSLQLARRCTAVVKGVIQGLFGIAVLAEVARKAFLGAIPEAPIMAVVAAIAFAANLACFFLLTRFRHQDINLRSVWLCSRNDRVQQRSVSSPRREPLPGSARVGRTWSSARWWRPLFLHTSFDVLRTAIQQLRQPAPDPCRPASAHGHDHGTCHT